MVNGNNQTMIATAGNQSMARGAILAPFRPLACLRCRVKVAA